MAFGIYHSFVSAKADSGDATLLQPSNWNAALVVAGADVGGVPYCPTAATITTSNKFTFDGSTLAVAAGTITTALSPQTWTETRNAAGVTFPGLKFAVTDTASAAGSFLLQLLGTSTGAANIFSVGKAAVLTLGENGSGVPVSVIGTGTFNGEVFLGANGSGWHAYMNGNNKAIEVSSDSVLAWTNSTAQVNGSSTKDTWLNRPAATVIASGTAASNSLGSFRGKYQSSDGTAGVASFGPAGVASITVKDGIITAIS